MLKKPEAAAERLARMLARLKRPAKTFAAIAAPVYVRGKKDRFPKPPGEDKIAAADQKLQTAISNADTS